MRALITGITGQDGSYLAEQLDEAGWTVYGMVHGQADAKWGRAQDRVPAMRLIQGDLMDHSSLQSALVLARPDVVFNLGALSFVGTSWVQPEITTQVTGLGALRMLEAIRFVNEDIRFVQASSSEMFGQATDFPLNEESRLAPCSPYAAAKVFAHHATRNYRESYGLHASTAISFNHESPRRGTEFVTRKVSRAVAAIVAGQQSEVVLGRLDPCRDWGWAPDYMKAFPLIAALDEPDDFVLATGEAHSVTQWCESAFAVAELDWSQFVRSDPEFCRPAEVEFLQGDASKAKRVLGWMPETGFEQIVAAMVISDIEESRG